MKNERLISDYIDPITQFGRTGHIHSVFGHSFNIKVQEQLLHVSSYQEYLSSFGIHIGDEQLQKILLEIEIGHFVKLQPQKMIIYTQRGLVEISLEQAKTISLKLSEISIAKEKLQKLTTKIASFELLTKIGLDRNSQTAEILTLLQSSKSLTATSIRKISQFLIGRGKGLTPSGDDLLVAYLATLTALKNDRAEKFTSYLKSQSSVNTTDVSKAYLEGVLQGYVSSPILAFFRMIQTGGSIELILEKFEAVLKIGHTSGKDMGFGIYLALCYYLNTIEER